MASRKMKSHSGAKKRFQKTGGGKWLRRKAGRRHILTSKKRDRKRRLKGVVPVSEVGTSSLTRLLPYAS